MSPRGPKSPKKPQKPTSKKLVQPSSPDDDIFRLIFSNVGAAIAVAQGEYMRLVNPKLCEYIGYTEEELLSRPFLSFIHPDDRTFVTDRYSRRLQGQDVPNEYSFRFIHKDGSIYWASCYGDRVLWNGQPTDIVYFREITEEHKHRTALKEGEERYRRLFEGMHQGVIYQDIDGSIIKANPAAEQILGLNREEMRNRPANDPRWQAIHEDDSPFPGPDHPSQVACRTGQPVNNVVMGVFNPRDQGTRWLHLHCVPLFHPGEATPYQLFTTFEDITERKQAEQGLVNKTLELDRFFTLALDLLSIADLEGHFRRVNPQWETTLGYSVDELEGRKFLDLVHPEDLPSTLKALKALANDQEVLNFTNRYRCKDGTYRFIEWRSCPAGSLIYAAARDITERKMIEQDLRASEEQLRAVMELSPDIISILDETGNIRYSSPSFERILGFAPKDTPHGNVFSIICPTDLANVQKRFKEVLDNPNMVHRPQEFRCLDHDGQIHWMESVASNQFHNPRIRGVLIVSRDITERKQAEQSLRESEEKLRTIMDLSPDIISILDENGTLLFESPASERILGFRPEEILGKNTFEYFHPEDRSRVSEQFEQFLSEPFQTREAQYRYQRKDGSYLWMEAMASNQLQNPVIHGVVAISRDITERKKIEQDLRESEEKLRTLMDLSPDIISILDGNGALLYESPASERIHGYHPDELLGQDTFELIHPEDRNRITETFKLLLNEPFQTRKAQYRYKNKDGSYVWMEAMASNQLNNPVLNGIMVVSRDITERIKTEESLRNTAKLESLGVLAGGIAHDFNNLLSGIFGYLELAQRYAANKRAENYLDRAMAVYNRARDLTQQLLTFSKGGDPVKKTLPLGPLLQEGVSFVLSGSNVIPIFDLPDDLWLCDIDEHQIGQVVDNLVINARQAMPTGGTVFIGAGNVPDTSLLPSHLPQGRYVKITIRDQGGGIPPEHLTRIFDPFFTTKQEGSGLGLATAHSIVSRHAGHIEVFSKLGQGSTFQVYLPASEKQAHPGTAHQAQKLIGRGRILFMDDEDFLREVSAEMLQEMGFQVECAKDGAEAVDLFTQAMGTGRPFNAVILDLTVPGGMGGREAVVKILERDPKALVIASSGYSSDPVMADPAKFGFAGKLPKPYRQADAAGILRTVLSRKK